MSSTEKPAELSLADRVTMPSGQQQQQQQQQSQPSPVDWAEEMSGPAQVDGASEMQMGGSLLEPEFDVNVKLSDLQADADNPLFSAVKDFAELNLSEPLLKGLAALNFTKPSKIQETALPLLLANPPHNMMGQSQSGTGKTAAFVLNILARVDLSVAKPQALVLAPSRELARQILGVVQSMAQFMNDLRTFQAVKDDSREQRGKPVAGHVVVGTPGTVFELIRRRQMDVSELKVLVLDEADNMLDQQGLGDQCKRIKNLLPKQVQTVLFSATFPERVHGFASIFAPNAHTLALQANELSVKGIKQMYLDVSGQEDKYAALCKFYGLMTIASSIIFVAKRDTATQLMQRMSSEGHQVAMLTGELSGQDRDNVIDQFRQGLAKVLIATNVLSRGLDVLSVTMVINYDIPLTADHQPDSTTFLHRVGRTGRFGKVGVALTLVSDKRSWQAFNTICREVQINPTKLDTDDWDNVERVVKSIIKSSRNVAVGTTQQEVSMG